MIEVARLCKSYGDAVVLRDLTCTFESGHVYSIVAPNGTGKTTFISILSGLLLPTEGTVSFSGGHSAKDTYIALAGDKNLYAKNTVRENATYVGRIRGKTTDEIRARTDFLRSRFPVYDEVFDRLVESISYGQKRLVALLNSVMADASCIIIDEVSEGLDLAHIALLSDLIDYLKEDRIVILASHDYEFVADVADRIWFLKDGSFQKKFEHLSKEELVRVYRGLFAEAEVRA